VQLYRSLMNGIANYDKELKKWVVKNEFAGWQFIQQSLHAFRIRGNGVVFQEPFA
jgi:hypothetical protein